MVCVHACVWPADYMESVTKRDKSITHRVTAQFIIQIGIPHGYMLKPGQPAYAGTALGKPRPVVTLHSGWHREEWKTSW